MRNRDDVFMYKCRITSTMRSSEMISDSGSESHCRSSDVARMSLRSDLSANLTDRPAVHAALRG